MRAAQISIFKHILTHRVDSRAMSPVPVPSQTTIMVISSKITSGIFEDLIFINADLTEALSLSRGNGDHVLDPLGSSTGGGSLLIGVFCCCRRLISLHPAP